MDFRLEKELDRAKTILTMGRPGEAQVRVPLSGKGETVTLMPVEQTGPAAFPVGPLSFTTETAQITWSPARGYGDRAPKGKAFLAIRGKIDGNVSYSIGQKQVTLGLPDGSTVMADELRQDHSAGNRGVVDLAFLVPDPYAGSYTLKIATERPAGATGSATFEVKAATGTSPGGAATPPKKGVDS